MAGALAEVLALAELLGRLERRGLRLWLCDLTVRAARVVFEYEGKQPQLHAGLELLRRHARVPKPKTLREAESAIDTAWLESRR